MGEPREMGKQQHAALASSSCVSEMLQEGRETLAVLLSWCTELRQFLLMPEIASDMVCTVSAQHKGCTHAAGVLCNCSGCNSVAT